MLQKCVINLSVMERFLRKLNFQCQELTGVYLKKIVIYVPKPAEILR